MAYFDAFTANLIRTDQTGQRVLCPFGRTVYAMSGKDELRIKRTVTAFYALTLVLIVATVVKLSWLWAFLLVPVFTAGFLIVLSVLARSLKPTGLTLADLTPLTPGQAFDATGAATGRMTLWALAVLSALMTAAGIWAAVLSKGRLWWSAAFFALCTAVFLVQLRRSRRS